MRWWPWLRWLFYSHDPRMHDLLESLHARMSALEAMLTPATVTIVHPELPPALVPRDLDCGHSSTSYFVSPFNGRTACQKCYHRVLEETGQF